MQVGAEHDKSKGSVTHSAIAPGTITITDKTNQQQDISQLSRDTDNANNALSEIFDKEKEQKRLDRVQAVGEIVSQVTDIAATEGSIAAAKARKDPNARNQAKQQLEAEGKAATDPRTHEVNKEANLTAHALVNAALAIAKGGNALDAGVQASGAVSGEAMAMIATNLYNKKPNELTETEKQTVSALSTLAGGLAGGLVGGNSNSAATGAMAGKTTAENNYLSVSEKSELEIAKQKLRNSKDPAEREQAQQKYDALMEKDIASDKEVIDACGNGNAGSAACAGARLKVIETKEGYESLGNYNSKASQQYADAYGQIVNLLNITSVDAQNQQQVKDAMVNYAMVQLGIKDKAAAEAYIETYDGMKIVAASVTPVLGKVAAKQLSKIVDANLKVVAKGNVDGAKFSDTNQGARPLNLADVNKPTLIDGRIQAKIEKQSKSLPNGNMATAHAEVGVIQQAFEKGMTKGREMTMSVSKEPVCGFCRGDVAAMADKAGLKSLTIYEETTGSVLYWRPGMKSLKARD